MVNRTKHVAILMATYNGADHLDEQLQSLAKQSHENWSLWVSDDGSRDDTHDILKRFAKRQTAHRVEVLQGPREGPIANFMSLVARVDTSADAFAFADQDDVWMPARLERSLAKLSGIDDRPALYGARTVTTDEALKPLGLSPLFARPPAFANALVQSLAGGNTMTLNRMGLEVMRATGATGDVVTHDWWAYQIVSGAGGHVIYDPKPGLYYRQHGANLIGSNNGTKARLVRAVAVWNDRFKEWNGRNIAALRRCEHLLTPQNRDLLHTFEMLRTLRGRPAVRALERSGIYRQTRGGDISLRMAAAMGKI